MKELSADGKEKMQKAKAKSKTKAEPRMKPPVSPVLVSSSCL